MSNEKHTERDYSLLRPFDLEAAKRGEAICFSSGAEIKRFIAGPDSVGDYVFVVPGGQFYFVREKAIRMSPLCWVEGRPVYRGDVLYQTHPIMTDPRVVENGCEDGITDSKGRWNGRDHLTWTPPKVKREGWVNIYPPYHGWVAKTSGAHRTKEEADGYAEQARIACVRIEWEEVAK